MFFHHMFSLVHLADVHDGTHSPPLVFLLPCEKQHIAAVV